MNNLKKLSIKRSLRLSREVATFGIFKYSLKQFILTRSTFKILYSAVLVQLSNILNVVFVNSTSSVAYPPQEFFVVPTLGQQLPFRSYINCFLLILTTYGTE